MGWSISIKLALLDATLPAKESIKSVKSEIKRSAEEIACVLAPIFIMAEIPFLSQYTAVSRDRRLTILIQRFYYLLLSVSDV